MYRDIPAEMRALIEPIVADHGLELVDIERRQGRAPWTLRVVVDTREGDGLVPVDRCAEVSREVGTHLDAAGTIPVAYNLEVSSPGLDRTLAREKDFERALGQEVKVETRAPVQGRRRFRGQLQRFENGTVHLEVDGQAVALPFAEISRARVVYEFTRADFAAKAGR